MGVDKLSEEVRKKLYSCETPEELLKTAAECGVELSEAELDMINDGTGFLQSVKDNLFVIIGQDDRTGHKLPDKDNVAYYITD